jgi:hypothetical protein
MKFDPTAITTSRILSGDDTPHAVKLQGQTKTLRHHIGVKSLAGHSGGATLASNQRRFTPRSR